ncbi:MAG: hypothetical protein Q7J07_07855 [Pelolinea sp.]|nr:hypothetical protein [Pelolinea sp.]
MPKIEINKKAPMFLTDDFLGNHISLEDFLNQKNVLLVFNRGFM